MGQRRQLCTHDACCVVAAVLSCCCSCPMIIFNKYDFSLTPLKERESFRKNKKENTLAFSCCVCVCVLFISMTYFTHTGITAVVKHLYDVDMTVYRSLSGYFCRQPSTCRIENKRGPVCFRDPSLIC